MRGRNSPFKVLLNSSTLAGLMLQLIMRAYIGFLLARAWCGKAPADEGQHLNAACGASQPAKVKARPPSIRRDTSDLADVRGGGGNTASARQHVYHCLLEILV